MKLQQRHLKIALGLLGVAILYNVWSFMSPRMIGGGSGPAPLLSGAPAPPPQPAASAQASIDPATIPPPPTVDLKTRPSWTRDPFLLGGETRDEKLIKVAAPIPSDLDPVVRSILFSPQRKLAVIQGRIYKVGDKVGTSEIVEIERAAVVIKTAAGETRRVELQSPASKYLQ